MRQRDGSLVIMFSEFYIFVFCDILGVLPNFRLCFIQRWAAFLNASPLNKLSVINGCMHLHAAVLNGLYVIMLFYLLGICCICVSVGCWLFLYLCKRILRRMTINNERSHFMFLYRSDAIFSQRLSTLTSI